MNKVAELSLLIKRLEEKLSYTRKLIAEYEETMDYASHCNLEGFAEGIEFTLEEIQNVSKEQKRAQPTSKHRAGKKSGR